MKINGYTLFFKSFMVEARIGVHDFERQDAQSVLIAIEIELDANLLPGRDDIAAAFDYDWVRDEVQALVAKRRFELQETLARAIVEILGRRLEIKRLVVETAKPNVYSDVAAVGCRLEARR